MSRPRIEHCPEPRELLLAWLGLVDDEVAGEIDLHARTCALCAEAQSAFARREAEMPHVPVDIGHIPPGLLARWERSRARLSPAALRAADAHLVACEECRDRLAQLDRLRSTPVAEPLRTDALGLSAADAEAILAGEDPERFTNAVAISDAPARSVDPPPLLHLPAAEAGAQGSDSGGRRTSTRERRILPWLGGYAAFATAAAIVFALREPMTQGPPPVPGAGSVPPAPSPIVPAPTPADPTPTAPTPVRPQPPEAEPAAPPRWRIAVTPRQPRIIPSQTRGGSGGAEVGGQGADGLLVVSIEAQLLDVAPDALATVEILDASKGVLARTRLPWRELEGQAELVIAGGGGTIPPGRYTLRISAPTHDGRAEGNLYPFEIAGKK